MYLSLNVKGIKRVTSQVPGLHGMLKTFPHFFLVVIGVRKLEPL